MVQQKQQQQVLGALTDENLRGLPGNNNADDDDEVSTTSFHHDHSPFNDEPNNNNGSSSVLDVGDSVVSRRSFTNSISTNNPRQQEGQQQINKIDSIYGSEGDLLWKALVVTLLTMIGTAAGFVYLFGLIDGDVSTTATFVEYTNHLELRAPDQAKEMNGGLTTWSVHASSFATLHPDTWPFHTFQHFHSVIHQTSHLIQDMSLGQAKETNVEWIATAPLVSDEIRTQWEKFSIQQQQQQHQQNHQHHHHHHQQQQQQPDQTQAGRALLLPTTTTTTYEAAGAAGRHLQAEAEAQQNNIDQELLPIHFRIHKYDKESGELVAEPEGSGPYTPLYQMSTKSDLQSIHNRHQEWNSNVSSSSSQTTATTTTHSILYNFNLLSIPAFARAFSLVQHTGLSVMSEPIFLQDSFYGSIVLNNGLNNNNEDDDVKGEPYSLLVNPILGRGVNTTTLDDTPNVVVGAMIGLVPYRSFFEAIIPMDGKGLSLVVRPAPTCTTTTSRAPFTAYTYRIDGANVTYVGPPGDNHDESYDYHETKIAWEPFVNHRRGSSSSSSNSAAKTTSSYDEILADYYKSVPSANDGRDEAVVYCNYEIYIYPTDAFYSGFRSNAPRIFAAFLVGIFLFVYIILNFYGYIMKRKDLVAHLAARRSSAIVDMFFPQEVKDRLMEEQKDEDCHGGDDVLARSRHNQSLVPAANDFSPARFLDDKPIASLFPETTIIFADIAGFTAWSSEREPSQVFILLETIYGEFDRIAKRRRVFKVETIGDCYLAVTGIPDPQKDHAVIMCQFARECMSKMYEVTAMLELTLGPDTSDLAMRMGLHSGPCTAGVLRGRKSHFQLFGDTVNTAARMESTGTREKIQLSQETADLLSQSGRSHWIKPRENPIEAKGKGLLPTFWLLPKTSKSATTTSSLSKGSSTSRLETDISEHADEDELHNKTVVQDLRSSQSRPQQRKTGTELSSKSKRLVQWNVALLVKLLGKVAASRKSQKVDDLKKLALLEQQYMGHSYILEEVQEVISVSMATNSNSLGQGLKRLPTNMIKKNSGAASIDPVVPDDVVSQLTNYVSKIAALHPQNPFHNFEHASHVTMSTSKLLSRIVNADAADGKVASTFNAGDVSLAGNQKRHAHGTSYGITSDPLTQFSVVFAALIHDVDHPGVSNAILATEHPSIGDLYHNKSVAEQKSLDIAWKLLMEPDFQALRHCIYTNEKQLLQFRQLLVNSVIATDIFDKEHSQFRKARWAKAFDENAEPVSGDTSDVTGLDRKATIVIEHLIQASDVSHTMQHWHVYQKWNARLFEEMFKAFKEGRSTSNPAESWYKGEIWFFDNYVIPLAKKLETCGVFGVSSDEFLNYATENRKEWETKGHSIVAEMVAKMNRKKKVDLTPSSRHVRND